MRYKEFFAVLIICCAIGCNNTKNPVSSSNNSAPIIQAVIFMPDTIKLGESCMIEVNAVDPDSEKLSYEWETVGNISGKGSIVWFTPNACCGSPSVIITVRDGNGGSRDSLVIVPIKY
jgi:hypothetical protein